MRCLVIKRESCRNVILRAIPRHFSILEAEEPVWGGCSASLVIMYVLLPTMRSRTPIRSPRAYYDLHGAAIRSCVKQTMTKRQSAEAVSGPNGTAPAIEPTTTRARLRVALAAARPAHRQPIGELLTSAGFVDDTGIHRALAVQADSPTTRLRSVLVATGEITEDELYRSLS